MNNQPFERFHCSYIVTTQMKKVMDINEEEIYELRNNFRPQIQEEQQKAWLESSRSKCPNENDSDVNKKLKFMFKFTLLDRFIRDQFENFDENLMKTVHFKRYK